jgi:hypothetical protein
MPHLRNGGGGNGVNANEPDDMVPNYDPVTGEIVGYGEYDPEDMIEVGGDGVNADERYVPNYDPITGEIVGYGEYDPGDMIGGVDISNPGQGGLNVVGSPSQM